MEGLTRRMRSRAVTNILRVFWWPLTRPMLQKGFYPSDRARVTKAIKKGFKETHCAMQKQMDK